MGTHYKGSEKEKKALNLFIKLMRASDSVMSRLSRHLAEDGLTPSQFGILETLYHLGPLSQTELGKKLLKSGGNITMVIDNLEKRMLVKRFRESSDRRFITVHLTEEGHNLIKRLFPEQLKAILHEMSVLTPEEIDEMDRLCRILGLKERP